MGRQLPSAIEAATNLLRKQLDGARPRHQRVSFRDVVMVEDHLAARQGKAVIIGSSLRRVCQEQAPGLLPPLGGMLRTAGGRQRYPRGLIEDTDGHPHLAYPLRFPPPDGQPHPLAPQAQDAPQQNCWRPFATPDRHDHARQVIRGGGGPRRRGWLTRDLLRGTSKQLRRDWSLRPFADRVILKIM